MKVGIIVYSHTGNTLSVAEKIEKALLAAGREASLERVEALDFDPNKSLKPVLKNVPDVSPYDAIIFASPVNAFTLAQVMKAYLAQISSLAGKKVYCFVTQHLKKPWMGGNRAVRCIKKACAEKGSNVLDSGVVNWSGDTRESQINDLVARLGAI